MALPTVRDVLSTPENMAARIVYERFRSCGILPNSELHVHVHATALFMWLGIVPVIHSYDNFSIQRLLREAVVVLNSLKVDDGRYCRIEVPLIDSISENIYNSRFFNQYKDDMTRSLVDILDGDGRIVFNDYLYGLFNMLNGWEQMAARAGMSVVMPDWCTVLFSPVATLPVVPDMENARSMFFSFLKRLQIEENSIKDYFTQKWGDCVEGIQILQVPAKRRGFIRGKIVFKSSTYLRLALNGQNYVIYRINGRELWARQSFYL